MQVLFYLILFCLLLLIISEPLYIRIEKENDTSLAFHFVFFSFLFIQKKGVGEGAGKPKKRSISPKSYIRAWLKLRKRVKIKIDALYFPLITSPYTQALLCGLFPAILAGEQSYGENENTSFALHIETTLPDCLILYFKAIQNEKKNEKVQTW
jgi:hypothetical protein